MIAFDQELGAPWWAGGVGFVVLAAAARAGLVQRTLHLQENAHAWGGVALAGARPRQEVWREGGRGETWCDLTTRRGGLTAIVGAGGRRSSGRQRARAEAHDTCLL